MFHERHKQILALLVSLAHLLLMMMITSCGEPAYAGLRRTRRGRATHWHRVWRGENRGKTTPHPSVLVGGVRQRRGAP